MAPSPSQFSLSKHTSNPGQSTISNPSITSTPSFSHRIRFIELPRPQDELITKNLSPSHFSATYVENHKPLVKAAITTAITSSNNSVLACFVIDRFCTSMIDVAHEFGVPSYKFFISGVALLNLMFYAHEQNIDTTQLKGSDTKLDFPSFLNPLPSKVLPFSFLEKEWLSLILVMGKRFRHTKGIMVNPFEELESHVLDSLSRAKNIPHWFIQWDQILNFKGDGHDDQSGSTESDIMKWLGWSTSLISRVSLLREHGKLRWGSSETDCMCTHYTIIAI